MRARRRAARKNARDFHQEDKTLKVILDCDPGNGFPGADIDDGLALGLILRSPELELLAVTVVAGNTPVEKGVRAGLAVLEAAGSDVPLYKGATRALVED